MVRKKEIRLIVTNPLHCVIEDCRKELGFTNLAEFVRIAIYEKLRRDCGEMLLDVQEIEGDEKKESCKEKDSSSTEKK